jgi:hypothetical protein
MKKTFTQSLVLSLLLAFFALVPARAQKMAPDEIVLKHLDSIGTKERRATVKNQLVLADLQFTVKGSARPVVGKAVLLAEGEKNLWGMNTNANDYPQDRFAYNGRETDAGFIRPGVRSTLGGFILAYKELLREGLLGGTLLSSWALLHTETRKPKLAADGTKKIDGQETYALEYAPRNGSDLSIKMYFDAKNFRHLRTEYTRVVSARQGTTVDNSAGQSSNYYRLVEDFSEFQTVNGLTIPKKYKLSYSFTGNGAVQSARESNREMEWTLTVTNLSLNQPLAANSFDINAQ